MVTASVCTLQLRGLQSGKAYSISFYDSDVVATMTKWSASGPAATTSSDFFMTPNEVCIVEDVSMLATPTVAVTLQYVLNDIPAGVIMLVGNLIYTNPTRAFPRVQIAPRTKLQLLQN